MGLSAKLVARPRSRHSLHRIARGLVSVFAAGVVAAGASGCVERRLIVRTDPPGARVEVDGVDRGESPATIPFVHYGTRRVVLRLDDHRTRAALVETNPPIWQIFPLDFVTDVLLPLPLVDEHAPDPFRLDPLPVEGAPSEEEDRALVARGAAELREAARENSEDAPR